MRLLVCVVALALASVACDDSNGVTGPTSETRVEAVIRDSSASPFLLGGTLSGNIFASVGTATRWIDLGSANGITVPLQSAASTTVHGEQGVPEGSYSRARLVFQGVTARISRGSIIDGLLLTNDATLTLGGSDGRVELRVSLDPFSVNEDPDRKRVVIFDLRSHLWVTAGAIQSGRVEDAALQAAISGTTRSEPR